jgi:hypothetical protein
VVAFLLNGASVRLPVNSLARLAPIFGLLNIVAAAVFAAQPAMRDRVASLGFEAELANWDADPHPDGFALFVQPVDCWGAPAPADGVVYVELTGAVRRSFHAAPHGRGAVCQTLGRWTKTLATSLPTDNGYLIKLPLPAGPLSPEQIASRGRMHVRLVVPGQGVFEAAREGVILVP